MEKQLYSPINGIGLNLITSNVFQDTTTNAYFTIQDGNIIPISKEKLNEAINMESEIKKL